MISHAKSYTQIFFLSSEFHILTNEGKEMATHSSMLAWEISWTEEVGRLQPMGSQQSWRQLIKMRITALGQVSELGH